MALAQVTEPVALFGTAFAFLQLFDGTAQSWRLPAGSLVIETGARLAVCFNAPVIELLSDAEERSHRSLARLGPDVLRPDTLDPAVVHERARSRAEASPTIGELLLDQQVVAGIGNIYRCEALFACRTNPRLASADVDDALLDRLVATASRLMVANARTASWSRSFDGAADQPWVYGRRDQPCRRCATPIAREILGHQARSVYWCPGCQPAPDRPVANGRPAAPAGR